MKYSQREKEVGGGRGGAGQREILFKKRTLISLRIFFFELDLVLV